MKKNDLLKYLEERMTELSQIKCDAQLNDRLKTMAAGAFQEMKMVYSYVKRQGD